MLAHLSATEASVIVQRCQHPLLITSASGRVKSCNKALEELALVTGLDVESLAAIEIEPEPATDPDREVGTVSLSRHGGGELHFEVHGFPLAGLGGERARIFIDVTDRLQRRRPSTAGQKMTSPVALTDPFSGALNTQGLLVALQPQLARSKRHARPLALLLLGLRQVEPGPGQIDKLVGALKYELRTHDTIARTGRQEFAVILPDTSIESALKLADKLERCLMREVPWIAAHGGSFGFGIAGCTSSDDAPSLLRRAASTLATAVSALQDHRRRSEKDTADA